MNRLALALALALAWAVTGCDADRASEESASDDAADAATQSEPLAVGERGAEAGESGVDDKTNATARSSLTARKIVYTADVSLKVKSLAETGRAVDALVKEANGHVASSSTGGGGRYRSGHWVLRIPVARFEGTLAKLAKLGDLERTSRQAEDVTAKYVDVEAHVKNLRQAEAHLQELLKKTNQVSELIKVEKELANTRTQLDSWQGQMNVLRDQIDLTTITLAAEEDRTTLGAIFGDEFRGFFHRIVRVLASSTHGLLMAIVAVAPWLLVLVPLVVGLIRWRARRKKRLSAQHDGAHPSS
jgi:hypothetical protein